MPIGMAIAGGVHSEPVDKAHRSIPAMDVQRGRGGINAIGKVILIGLRVLIKRLLGAVGAGIVHLSPSQGDVRRLDILVRPGDRLHDSRHVGFERDRPESADSEVHHQVCGRPARCNVGVLRVQQHIVLAVEFPEFSLETTQHFQMNGLEHQTEISRAVHHALS